MKMEPTVPLIVLDGSSDSDPPSPESDPSLESEPSLESDASSKSDASSEDSFFGMTIRGTIFP